MIKRSVVSAAPLVLSLLALAGCGKPTTPPAHLDDPFVRVEHRLAEDTHDTYTIPLVFVSLAARDAFREHRPDKLWLVDPLAEPEQRLPVKIITEATSGDNAWLIIGATKADVQKIACHSVDGDCAFLTLDVEFLDKLRVAYPTGAIHLPMASLPKQP